MRPCPVVVLASVVVAALVAGPGGPAGAVAGFGDVEADRYYAEPVQWMVDEAVTTGTSPTCFSPDTPVTRGQVAAFLHRAEGEPTPAGAHPFTDVEASWQQAPVSWLAGAGATTGTSATTFGPDEALTRGQFAAFLHRLAGSPPVVGGGFADVTAPWQLEPVAWLVARAITNGTSPTTFSPDEEVTRGQVAAFLHRWAGAPAVAVDPASPWCDPVDGARTATDTGFRSFAGAGGVVLLHPARWVELIGYHESNHDGALALEPGPGTAPTVTMDSRGRGTHPRSAADVVVPPSAEVRSPVSGVVLRAGTYVLYCDHRDEFAVIAPDARPDLEVKVLHVDGLRVRPGDRVVAGTTVLADRATQLPFTSQVDRLTAAPSWPHVHVEVVDPSVPDRPGSGC